MKYGYGLSIFLHVALAAWLLTGIETKKSFEPLKTLRVRTLSQKDFERQLKDALETNEAQIVQGDDHLPSQDPPDAKNKLRLSKNNQRVDRESRAAKFGKFHNNLEEAVVSSSPEATIEKLFALTPNPRDLEQLKSLEAKTGRLFTPKRAPASIDSGAESSSDDYLPDIAVGVNTLLNTKEYKFYGFFERIRARLTDVWHLKLRNEFEKVARSGQNISGDHVTKIQVRLDPNGMLKSLDIVGASGVSEFDRAAREAFQSAAPFPNPPLGMIESDQSVSIRWDFVVVASEDSGVQVRIERGAF